MIETKLLKESQIKTGAEIIQSGGTAVFRTETVYGLGADATNEEAVEKIFSAKGRPAVNPLIVHFYSIQEIFDKFDVDKVTKKVLKKIKSAITVILPRPDWIPHITTGGLDTVAVRVPACRFARRFIRACGVPLAAPSANTSTRPSPTRWQDAREDLNGKVDAIFCGAQTKIGLESTVVKVIASESEHKIQVLRLGGISNKDLARKTGLPVEHNPTHESPGTQFKHYAPRCPLYIVKSEDCPDRDDNSGHRVQNRKAPVIIRNADLGKDAKTVAKNLFAAIRAAEKNADLIIVEALPDTPEYQAVNERLKRAAGETMSISANNDL